MQNFGSIARGFLKASRSSILEQGDTTQKYFPMNDSLLLLIYPVKQLAAFGRLQNQLIMEYERKFLVSTFVTINSLFTLENLPL